MAGLLDGGIAAWAGSVLMVAARVVGLAVTAPGWGTPGLGWRLRVGLILLVTGIVAPAVQADIGEATAAWSDLPVLAAGEAAVGAGLGVAMALVIAGARQAGELIGLQAGLSVATVLDPEAAEGLTPTGHLYGLLALGAFLVLDGPLRLVTVLIESYRAMPVGGPSLSTETVSLLFAQVGWALGLALRAAAPVGLALIGAGLALGLLARIGGGLPLASLTWPVRAFLGVILVLLSLAAAARLLGDEWAKLAPQAGVAGGLEGSSQVPEEPLRGA
jgi:flagellar biosynthetic protein FliR